MDIMYNISHMIFHVNNVINSAKNVYPACSVLNAMLMIECNWFLLMEFVKYKYNLHQKETMISQD